MIQTAVLKNHDKVQLQRNGLHGKPQPIHYQYIILVN